MSTAESIESVAARVRAGELDPVALVEQALTRAERAAGLNAVVYLDAEAALDSARLVARDRRGALAGIPILVKEVIEVAGLPFRCGSTLFADRIGQRDAEVVRRAGAEGAIVIGLAHSHEFAYGCTGTSNRAGPCHNPADPSRIAGGSSSGSAAAVAAGVVSLALGTDTSGSIRLPAALCGVVGVKPARGTLPLDGVFPLSTSLDQVGVITRSVADADYAVGVLAGLGTRADAQGSSPFPTVGVVANAEALDCAPEVWQAFDAALSAVFRAGAPMFDVQLPDWGAMIDAVTDTQGPEAAAAHAELFATQASLYQPDVRDKLWAAMQIPGWRYIWSRAHAVIARDEASASLASCDAVVLPTVPIVAPGLHEDEIQIRDLLLRNTRPASLTGHAAISIPLPTGGGLPVGLQVIAADNRRAFQVARWIEQVLAAGAGPVS
ncbi:MAG: amidase [Geodermatophilaceae bacterium]|nr:amidase [Geodermatophilaceae bacterium]